MSSKNSIGVIGNGFVGGSLTTVMSERGFDVYVYDKVGKLASGGIVPNVHTHNDGRRKIDSIGELVVACENLELTTAKHVHRIDNFSGVYFVCVPTPMKEDGSCDTSIVEDVLRELANASSKNDKRIAVIKSTVPPGSTERWNKQFEGTGLRVVFSPEFLTEANALDDMRNQNRIVLGGPRPHINKVKQVFQTAFPSVPIIKTSSTTAEMVKYLTNIHLAAKVALANEFYQICEALDKQGNNIDYDKVIEYATLDERLGKSHWAVPGPMPSDETGKPAFGFGGSCFVKDINALIHLAKSIGIDPKVMNGAWTKNVEIRPERDWELLVGRAVSRKK